MKQRSWIKALAVSALSSPRAAFRKANSSLAALPTTVTSIPLPVLATLTRVIQFLDKNHLQEEGLYSKPGVGLERKEICRCCKSHELPNLSLYSPHSIASAVKEILNELYGSLIPNDISQQLVEAASGGHIDDAAERTITDIFKQIPSSTREFLQVFLSHLNSVAESGSSRMSVTNVALHIGIALVRPTEDKTISNSKNMIRRRKCIAEFLIREASSLPYDCATEMNIPAIPESVSTPKRTTPPRYFVQVTWDAGQASFTPEQLEKMFGKFGEIENFGINDQGNRAIIAYTGAAAAEAARQASIPFVRVRRRKPRQGDEISSRSPKHSKPNDNFTEESDARDAFEDVWSPLSNKSTHAQDLSEPEGNDQDNMRLAQPQKILDDTMVVEDIEDDQFEYQKDSTEQTQTDAHIQSREDDTHTDTDDRMNPNDNDSDNVMVVNVPMTTQELEQSSTEVLPSNQIKLEEQHISIKLIEPERDLATKDEIVVKEKSPDEQGAEVNSASTKASNENSPAPTEITTDTKAEVTVVPSLFTPPNDHLIPLRESNQENLLPNTSDQGQNPHNLHEHLAEQSSIDVTELSEIPSLAPADNEKLDLTNNISEYAVPEECESAESIPQPPAASVKYEAPIFERENSLATIDSTKDDPPIEALQSRLLDMEKILSTSTAALSSTKLTNEFERAVLQLHKQILDMVAECLALAGGKHGEVFDKSMIRAATNAEFLDFLEAQAKTQVKILEVEVRAGQELLRLHKTQYEKERIELEEEITTLRVGRTETERLCAELRTDLRKCRSELACHVANATDIQRQKSMLEEKLVAIENRLHGKEIAMVKLQEGYDKMQRVAAEAQIRVEKFKQDGFNDDSIYLDNQLGHASSLSDVDKGTTKTRTRVNEDLPHTTKLFSEISKRLTNNDVMEDPGPPVKAPINTPATSSQPSNTAALEAMKEQMARDIQEQITTTRAALREMEICSSSGKTLEEEEEELRQLQKQLAAKSFEIDRAMDISRTKLKELLDPTTASIFCGDRADYDDQESNQEPTIFDSTALVNELIVRAEKTPAMQSFPRDSSSSHLGMQKPFTGIEYNQQLAQYHPPTRRVQSILYKRWTADRSRKIAQLASYRDQQAVLNAQQSMQAFQQTLAEFRSQR